jgi:hypothetical protein
LRLLLDEMCSAVHAEALQAAGMHATTVLEFGLAGSSDPEVFAVAIVEGSVLLTENVADFTRISAEHLLAGRTGGWDLVDRPRLCDPNALNPEYPAKCVEMVVVVQHSCAALRGSRCDEVVHGRDTSLAAQVT